MIRVGINSEHVEMYDIPENPDRPGTYQWEGLPDSAAEELIGRVWNYFDPVRHDEVIEGQKDIEVEFREHVGELLK